MGHSVVSTSVSISFCAIKADDPCVSQSNGRISKGKVTLEAFQISIPDKTVAQYEIYIFLNVFFISTLSKFFVIKHTLPRF